MNSQDSPIAQPSIISLYKKAWINTYGIKWQIMMPVLLLGFSLGIINMLMMWIGITLKIPFVVFYLLTFTMNGILVWSVMVSLIMIGVYKANNQIIKFRIASHECYKAFNSLVPVITLALAISLVFSLIKWALFLYTFSFLLHELITLFAIFIILPLTIFAIPFVVNKTYDAKNAIIKAYQLAFQNCVVIFATWFLMAITVALSALPILLSAILDPPIAYLLFFAGFGLVWTIPMVYTMHGLIFATFSGAQIKVIKKLEHESK